MAKRTLPNGEVVPLYSASDRAHAKWLFFIGSLAMAAWIVVWLHDIRQ